MDLGKVGKNFAASETLKNGYSILSVVSGRIKLAALVVLMNFVNNVGSV